MFGKLLTTVSHQSREIRLKNVCANVGDAGIAGVFLVAPLFLGGRHGLGALVYAIMVTLAAVGVFGSAILRKRIVAIPRSIQWFLLGTGAIGLFQLIPLPPNWVVWLSPEQASRLFLGATDWLSLTPNAHATRYSFAILIIHALLLLTLHERLRSREDAMRLMRLLSLAVVGMTVIGLLQYLSPNGKLLWFYSYPHMEFGQVVQGTFSNRNHMAHFLVLGLGPLCWFAHSLYASSGNQTSTLPNRSLRWLMLALGAIILVVVSALATRSRGGAGALAASCFVIAFCYWRIGTLQAKHVIVLALLLVIAIGGVSLFGYEHVSGRLDDLVSGDLEELDSSGTRRAIWGANLNAFTDSPLLGFGLGTHRDVYPLFLEESFPVEFTHAESSYLQIASESGLAGLLLLAFAVIVVVQAIYYGLRNLSDPNELALWAAIIAGLTASLVHAVVDFVWYIPSLMAVTIALAVCALRYAHLSLSDSADPLVSMKSSRRAQPKRLSLPAIGQIMAMTIATLWVFTVLPGIGFAALRWDSYLHCSNSLRELTLKAIGGDENITDQYLHETLIHNTIRSTTLLEQVVALDPTDGRAHLRLAGRYLQQFELEQVYEENRMPVEYLRDAALNGGFENTESIVAWIEQVYGPRAELLKQAHYHAKQAVKRCPLEGAAYLNLATLCFLETEPADSFQLVDQALLVRPYEGEVLFQAGRQHQLAGDWDQAMAYWTDAIARPGGHQSKLTAMLAPLLPAKMYVEQLSPNQKVLDVAVKQYRLHGDEEDLLALADYARILIEQSDPEEKPSKIANRWRQLSAIQRSLERYPEAIDAAEKAFELDPYGFYIRLEMASALYKGEKFEAADPHIRWCLARRPDINYLKSWLVDSAKRRTKVDQNRRRRLYTLRETPRTLKESSASLVQTNSSMLPNVTPTAPYTQSIQTSSDRVSQLPQQVGEGMR